MNSANYLNSHIFFLKSNDNLEIYETSFSNGNNSLFKVESGLDDSVLNNVKQVKTAGMGSRRGIILTNDGRVYGRGLYGAFEQFGRGVLLVTIADGNSFAEFDLGNVQGKVTNLASNPYYDIFTTDEGTYLHGILPSQIMYGHREDSPTKPIFMELTYDGKAVITKSVYCQELASCFIQTIDDEILFIGKDSYYSVPGEFVADELHRVDYTGQLVTNDDIDFDRTFSDSGRFIVNKLGEVFFSINSEHTMYPLENPRYYPAYEDYLAQRKQEYIDEIDQSIVDEYYESIKSNLPQGNIIK